MTLMLYNTPEEFAMRVLEFFLIGKPKNFFGKISLKIAGTEAIMHISIKLLSTAQQDILRRNRIEVKSFHCSQLSNLGFKGTLAFYQVRNDCKYDQ